ncbi:MAG: PfkB family carbohydrate kinase [Bdellovibrionota bacterium]
MSSIVVVGSMAFDTIETPFGKKDKILGGSANYFSLSASQFVPVKCVSVVGKDFPEEHLALLKGRNIDLSGVRHGDGDTFHWSGRYGYDLNEAQTLGTELNVFETFEPELPESYRDAKYVFLGNIAPPLQMKVLEQVRKPHFVALDSMNFWIEGQRDALIKAISKCHAVVINEGEVRQLTEKYNMVDAAQVIRKWGPQILVVKRGEYGAVLFDHGDPFCVPGLPLAEVKDPTGAGDTFAGGFMGFLASQANTSLSRELLRRAVVYGSVMASFTVQDFGFGELLKLSKEKIEERYRRFVELTRFTGVA